MQLILEGRRAVGLALQVALEGQPEAVLEEQPEVLAAEEQEVPEPVEREAAPEGLLQVLLAEAQD